MIHLVSDSHPCECCGETGNTFLPGMCDAHTHGLDEYGSPELQLVLDVEPSLIGYILNTVGDMVRDGLVLKDRMEIKGLFEGDVGLKTFFTKNVSGKRVCRLIIPDTQFKYPEESEEYPYNMQYDSPYKETKEMYS